MTPLALSGQGWQKGITFRDVLLSVGGLGTHKKTYRDKDACKPRFRKPGETCRTSKGCMDPGSASRDWNQANGLVTEGKAGLQTMGDWAKGEFVNATEFAGKVITTVFLCEFTRPRHGPAQRTAESCASEPSPSPPLRARHQVLLGRVFAIARNARRQAVNLGDWNVHAHATRPQDLNATDAAQSWPGRTGT